MRVQILSNLKRWFISIHKWHIAVQKDKIVIAELVIVPFYVFVNNVKGVLAVKSIVTHGRSFDTYFEFQDDFDSFDVELLVIDD